MAKPSTVPTWDTNQTNIATPPAGNQTDGFATGDQVPSGRLNYMFYWLYKWAKYLNDLAAGTEHWPETQTFDKGLVATTSVANTTPITGTGNGTGVGGAFTGGTTSGAGATGTAGTGSNGAGLVGTGDGTGYGGSFVGGATGTGVSGTGGASGGDGASFFGTVNGRGGAGTGSGSGCGWVAASGATGDGLQAYLNGTVTANTNTRFAVDVLSGHVKLGGGNPSVTTSFSNVVTPPHIAKARGSVGMSSGTYSLNTNAGAGVNVSSTITGTTTVVISFAAAMASSNYQVHAWWDDPGGSPGAYVPQLVATSKSTSSFTLTFYKSSDGSTVNANSFLSGNFSFVVWGGQ